MEKKRGCFVTTTVCEILGKDDNCYELEILRKFRDTKLLADDSLKNLVYQYYEISPEFVGIIKRHPTKDKFAKYLMDEYIQNIIIFIQAGRDIEAIELYQKMLARIKY